MVCESFSRKNIEGSKYAIMAPDRNWLEIGCLFDWTKQQIIFMIMQEVQYKYKLRNHNLFLRWIKNYVEKDLYKRKKIDFIIEQIIRDCK